MREFFVLLGELLLIALSQTVIESFLKEDKREFQMRFVNIACILGSLFLLLQFVYDNILSEISTFVKFTF